MLYRNGRCVAPQPRRRLKNADAEGNTYPAHRVIMGSGTAQKSRKAIQELKCLLPPQMQKMHLQLFSQHETLGSRAWYSKTPEA